VEEDAITVSLSSPSITSIAIAAEEIDSEGREIDAAILL
jgi:hypothetical protein